MGEGKTWVGHVSPSPVWGCHHNFFEIHIQIRHKNMLFTSSGNWLFLMKSKQFIFSQLEILGYGKVKL